MPAVPFLRKVQWDDQVGVQMPDLAGRLLEILIDDEIDPKRLLPPATENVCRTVSPLLDAATMGLEAEIAPIQLLRIRQFS